MNRIIRWVIILSLFAAFIGYQGTTSQQSVAHATEQTIADGYTKDQLDALNYLNQVRSKLGLQTVQLNANITKAAKLHAHYYNTNLSNEEVSLKAHKEQKGLPGFMGESAPDRLKASGWVASYQGAWIGEVMHFGQGTSTDAMKAWLDSTAYHRTIILDPAIVEIGIGLEEGTAVVNVAGPYLNKPMRDGIAVYPYDGMTNAIIGFYGNEIPNPLTKFGVKYSGTIISATTPAKRVWYNAVITDEKGKNVPFYAEDYDDETLYLYPKNVLQGYQAYKVSLTYQLEGSDEKLNKTWSFKTGVGHKLIALQSKYAEVVVNEGGVQPLSIINRYDDDSYDDLTNVTYSVTPVTGLTVSADGMVKGIKAGTYTVSAKSGSIKLPVKVKVLAKLKTKAYPAANPSTMTDIANHPAKSSIEWAMREGVMTGAAKNLFKPDAAVTEAEFWTMFLRLYKVNYEAYSPAAKGHWADGAYRIATERNFPLDGLKKKEAKDGKITRLKAAEIIAAADGVNYISTNAIWYVIAMDYARGVTERSVEGFQANTALTRAETAKMLQYLAPKLKEMRGRPTAITSGKTLPKLPSRTLYVKPDKLDDYSVFAGYSADRKLTVEGKFVKHAGEAVRLLVQADGKALEEQSIVLDSKGEFRVTLPGPYQQSKLSIYVNIENEAYYALEIEENTMYLAKFK
ncbi:SCP-like extracellular [Paenibacillus curdlanolyticus YK9]|uniref:SCP-like extracellular n=1 Tax=Paenibacillus curdlanolyticus YK9 TaxID=717606 RepID=E0ICT6_9BACL|nr:S-layer homology domain-containing protein [Paenibacillus curdlanolyticus]EFM09972.1 SCP-like extracellular [Paenibacillus curdlanolyticus YK9]